MSKKIDCVTFFSENFMFEFRYNVLKDFIDTFVVCESVFDHRGNKKELNFKFKDYYDKKKINYIVLDQLKEAKATKISIANPPAF